MKREVLFALTGTLLCVSCGVPPPAERSNSSASTTLAVLANSTVLTDVAGETVSFEALQSILPILDAGKQVADQLDIGGTIVTHTAGPIVPTVGDAGPCIGAERSTGRSSLCAAAPTGILIGTLSADQASDHSVVFGLVAAGVDVTASGCDLRISRDPGGTVQLFGCDAKPGSTVWFTLTWNGTVYQAVQPA
jgi:hypothetical protein